MQHAPAAGAVETTDQNATATAAVHRANLHFYHLGWVAPDDMHMVVQKNNISQPGVKGGGGSWL